MRGWFLALLLLLLCPVASLADVIVPTRVIRARDVIGPDDVSIETDNVPGAADQLIAVIGMEARINLYPGRPIRLGDLGPPALIERNQLVTLIYRTGGLKIATEGRVLDRGAAGEIIRVMNLQSRISVTGTVQPDGTIEVN